MPFPWDAVIGLGSNIGSAFLGTHQWKMQNKYNDPGQQKARLERAGLNPALMYKGGIQNTAGSVPHPNMQPITPQMELLTILSQTQDMRIKEQVNDRDQRSANTAYELGEISKIAGELSNIKNAIDLGEYSSDRARTRREGLKEDEYHISLGKRRQTKMHTDILIAGFEELKKYASLIPKAEYALLTEKWKALNLKNEWQEFVNKHQYELVDPEADLSTRLIQANIQELLRGSLMNPKAMEFINRFLPVNILNK